jgi:outer membrane lipoprotein-sorting protein
LKVAKKPIDAVRRGRQIATGERYRAAESRSPEEFMRLSFARAVSATCAALACGALLIGTGDVWAQTVSPASPSALPAIAPLPAPSPLRKGATERAPVRLAQQTTGAVSAKPEQAKAVAGKTALNSAQVEAVQRVNTYFNSIKTMVGSFVQIGPDRRRTEGDFYLLKPGKVRFEYNPPSPVQVIADGSTVAVRDRKLATQDLYPLSQTPLRFLLAEKLDLLKDTNVVGVYQDDLFVTVVIEENHAVVGTHKLMLMFGAKDSELKQWTITDPQGFDTTIAIYNLDPTKRPDPSMFRIEVTREQ